MVSTELGISVVPLLLLGRRSATAYMLLSRDSAHAGPIWSDVCEMPLRGRKWSCCRETGCGDKSQKKLLAEATAVLGKASAAFYSLMRACTEFQVN